MKVLQILVLIFGLTFFANAQSAVLSGTVYDHYGSVIPSSLVKLRDSKGKEYQTYSNEDGVYQIKLAKVFYSIEINTNLFKSFRIKKYFVPPFNNGKIYLDVALDIAGSTDAKGFF